MDESDRSAAPGQQAQDAQDAQDAASTGPRSIVRVVRHPAPIDFRTLCERVLPPQTRYLVLDLDRTVHLAVNTGEMLGWELNAHHCYGPERLAEVESIRGSDRMFLDRAHPVTAAYYFLRGLRQWAVPGLYYLLWGKLAVQIDWLHRIAVRRHGPNAMQHAQRATQLTLMRLLQTADPALVQQLAEQVWQRHRGLQVITREDLQWARERCPQMEVILASASPRPTVQTAARHLGIETCVYSTLERINSGEEKIVRLRELRPGIFDSDVLTVGISDTQYGEDHCWARYFHTVVDINSTWPFPDTPPPGSPLREIHSAQVLTQDELRHRAQGEPDYLDPHRQR